METPTQNQKSYKRKFWFPVGVFSLVLLPLLLYQNLNNKIEKEKSYCQEVTFEDSHVMYERIFHKTIEISLDSISKKLSTEQKQLIYDKLGFNKRSYDSILNFVVSTPQDFNYQDFITFNDSLISENFAYSLTDSNISVYRNFDNLDFCGTPFTQKNEHKINRAKLHLNLRHYFILGICFPALVFFNLRNLLNLIRSRRNHFPAKPYMQIFKCNLFLIC